MFNKQLGVQLQQPTTVPLNLGMKCYFTSVIQIFLEFSFFAFVGRNEIDAKFSIS